jgi:hypothetical protein
MSVRTPVFRIAHVDGENSLAQTGLARPPMKSDKPFRKSFLCAGALYVVKAVLLIAIAGFQNIAHWLGFTLPSCVLAALITGTWGYFSKKSWSWLRFIVTILILHFILGYLAGAGSRSARENSGPVEIERSTFSVSLPKGWREDQTDKDFNGTSTAFFEKSADCFFSVVVQPKSPEVSATTLLEIQKGEMEKKFTNVKFTAATKWGAYDGTGFDVAATYQGTGSRGRIFAFESSGNACLVCEMASDKDYRTAAADFATIRESFKLK